MFCDEAKIFAVAGKGGNGKVSMRREAYVPKGGPDGGDGGRGGNIIFKADHNQNTLSKYKAIYTFKAEDGGNGGEKNKHGKNGQNRILLVPVGTILKIGEERIDLDKNGEEVTVLKGGRGGFGNAHFKSSLHRAPKFAEKGEPGHEAIIYLELKLVADVGIIGFPSVGKSTLISVVSNSRPKIAEYHFTTLIPNLGVCLIDETELVLADIPGLIEGAAEGKGLGNQFLKHIERCGILVHVLDVNSKSVPDDYLKIRIELKKYSLILAKKKEIVVINKIDSVTDDLIELIIDEFKKEVKGFSRKKIYAISAVTKQGLTELLRDIAKMVKQNKEDNKKQLESESEKLEYKIYKPHLKLSEDAWHIDREGENFVIRGARIEQIAVMTDWSNEMSLVHLKDVLLKKKIIAELKKEGFEYGKPLFIGNIEVTGIYEGYEE